MIGTYNEVEMNEKVKLPPIEDEPLFKEFALNVK